VTPHFNVLKIKDIRRETADAVSVAFDLPPEIAYKYRFSPGEYLTLRHDFDGEDVRRCYSISSGLDDGDLRVAIKKVEGGLFSNFAFNELKCGMDIEVMTPMGGFSVPIEPENKKNYLAFAAGSGITPVMSILRTVLTREPLSSFTLFYGNRDTNSIIFRNALEDLKDEYMERLSVFHTLSREATDVPLYSGRLDAERLNAFAGRMFDPAAIDHVFACGPGNMTEEVRRTLLGLGLDAARIHLEVFTPADGERPRRPAPAALQPDAQPGAGVQVTTILDGTARRFSMPADADNVVDAAHASGIELPYSCKGGMCSTCRAKIVEGTADMAANYSLELWELEAGYVLTCQARPTSETLTLDYDQV